MDIFRLWAARHDEPWYVLPVGSSRIPTSLSSIIRIRSHSGHKDP